MRQTRVPAQITTVEDKIAGNLSFLQILLLVGALFSSTFVYLVFPKPLHLTLYKIPFMICVSSIFLLLALRIKGKVIIQWILLITRYSLRPRFYVFNKNDMVYREAIIETVQKAKARVKQNVKITANIQNPSMSELFTMRQLLLDPKRNVSFSPNKKGGINVSVS